MSPGERHDDAQYQVAAAKTAGGWPVETIKSTEPRARDGQAAQPERSHVSVTDARANLVAALAELDDALSIKAALHRHPGGAAVVSGLAVLAIAGAIVRAVRKKK